MLIEDFVLDLKRAAAVFLTDYTGERDDASREEWCARLVAWRDTRALAVVKGKREKKAQAEQEELSKRLQALDIVMVTDAQAIAAVEATVPEKE